MNELYETLKEMFSNYSPEDLASEILDVDGMEDAIVKELKSRGYNIYW